MKQIQKEILQKVSAIQKVRFEQETCRIQIMLDEHIAKGPDGFIPYNPLLNAPSSLAFELQMGAIMNTRPTYGNLGDIFGHLK